MYVPAHFDMKESAEMTRFIQENSFGILFSQVGGQPFATHVPMLIDAAAGHHGRLRGHVARANPHWRELDGAEVLVVFAGAHAYISPSWYVEAQAVPTWNYVAVHVYGRCRVMQEPHELGSALADTVRFYEPNSPLLDHLDEEFYTNMARGIVGFDIEITRMEGKAKLSQNRSAGSVQGVIDALRQSPDFQAAEVARLMERSRSKG